MSAAEMLSCCIQNEVVLVMEATVAVRRSRRGINCLPFMLSIYNLSGGYTTSAHLLNIWGNTNNFNNERGRVG